jgi:hypothetical protein
MKIKTWIKYEEAYLPTPRCRKLRYREHEEFVDIVLTEVPFAELRKAFEDKSYGGKGLIYSYNDRLWTAATIRDICGGGAQPGKYTTPLEAMKWWNENSSMFFSSRYTWHPNRTDMIGMANAEMNNYLLVDGELYVCTDEPRYCIYTFGLGHNHGGTSLSVDYRYNENISAKRYFSALDGQKAVEEANKIAAARGDTDYVGKFTAEIVVYQPECVTCNPAKDHGDGSELLNSVEAIITGSENATEAALMCMATTII